VGSQGQRGELNAKQAAFVTAWLGNGGNGKQAAIAAGYSPKSAEQQASYLRSLPKVAAAISEGLAKAVRSGESTAAKVVRELDLIAHSDLTEILKEDGTLDPAELKKLPPEVRRAISAFEVIEDEEEDKDGKAVVRRRIKVKLWDKNRALDTLAKKHGLLVEKVEHSATGQLEELLTLAAARRKAGAR
jgi:phage terminase small subunit